MKNIKYAAAVFMLLISLTGCLSDSSVKVVEDRETTSYAEGTPSDSSEKADHESSTADQKSDTGKTVMCRVYVCGAVINEGVYSLPEGSIINDALSAAGGYTGDALHGYVNLAGEVTDGMRIYFPFVHEKEDISLSKNDPAEKEAGTKININTAGKEQLMKLPGIGESRAADIISYREKNGDFKSIDEIKKISGIKDNIFEKIKDLITI